MPLGAFREAQRGRRHMSRAFSREADDDQKVPRRPGTRSEVDGQGAVVEGGDVERVALGAGGPLLAPQGEERAVEPLHRRVLVLPPLVPVQAAPREGRLGLRVGNALARRGVGERGEASELLAPSLGHQPARAPPRDR